MEILYLQPKAQEINDKWDGNPWHLALMATCIDLPILRYTEHFDTFYAVYWENGLDIIQTRMLATSAERRRGGYTQDWFALDAACDIERNRTIKLEPEDFIDVRKFVASALAYKYSGDPEDLYKLDKWN